MDSVVLIIAVIAAACLVYMYISMQESSYDSGETPDTVYVNDYYVDPSPYWWWDWWPYYGSSSSYYSGSYYPRYYRRGYRNHVRPKTNHRTSVGNTSGWHTLGSTYSRGGRSMSGSIGGKSMGGAMGGHSMGGSIGGGSHGGRR